VLGWIGKEAGEVNFGGEWWLSAVRYQEEKGNTPATRGFIHAIDDADEDVRARHSSKQLRGQARGGAGRSGSAPAAEHPPCPNTIASPIHSVCSFAKFAQNLNWSQNSTKTKVVQNFVRYKTCFGDQSQF